MNRCCRPICLITIVTLFSVTLSADTGIRKYAGEFMSIDVSARAQAMGGAFTALSNDVYASFYNPAGLVQVQSMQIGATHTQQFLSSVNYDFLGFAYPASNGKTMGFSLIRLGIDNIKDSRAAGIFAADANGDLSLIGIDESQLTSFNSSDYVFFFSLGQQMTSRLAWGFNVKFIRRNLADHSANGLGFDGGLMFSVNNKWKLSGMLRNVTTTLIAWDTGEKELVSPAGRIGTSYLIPLPGLGSYLIPNVDLVFQSDSPQNLASDGFGSGLFSGAVGGEFVVKERLFLRGGYDDLQRVNFGVGIRIPHISVDYAFTGYDQELGNAHRIGFVVDFGTGQ